MRRFLAITITLLLSITLAAPLFATDTALGNLPECCRRSGRHHCAAGMAEAADRTVSTIAPRCPNYPPAAIAPLPAGIAPARELETSTLLYTHPATRPQIEARYRISHARTRQKRGPPHNLL